MEACGFEESNAVLGKPEDMTHDECSCLQILRTVNECDTPVVISCWQLTKEELEQIIKTGRVWLTVCGYTMPPVALTVRKPWE